MFLLLTCGALLLSAGCTKQSCDAFVGAETRREKDLDSSFSIAVPVGWTVKASKDEQTSELLVKAAGSCKVTMLITSRELSSVERSQTSLQLIDAMLNSSLEHLRSSGKKVGDYGKYRSFKENFPSFVIVSEDSDGKRRYGSYGAVSESRNLSIIVSARATENSQALADLLRSLVDSIELY